MNENFSRLHVAVRRPSGLPRNKTRIPPVQEWRWTVPLARGTGARTACTGRGTGPSDGMAETRSRRSCTASQEPVPGSWPGRPGMRRPGRSVLLS